MKAGIAALILLISVLRADVSSATEIDGKWGLGVAIGSLFSSGAEASIIRGRSVRTAWIVDLSASIASDHRNSLADYLPPYYPDTTIAGSVKYESVEIELGPRLRQFTSPTNPFSPYWDVYAHFAESARRQSFLDNSISDTQLGGKFGIAIGVEYFSTRWPFSVGAHTNLASFSVMHTSRKGNELARTYTESGTTLSGTMTLRPVLQVRVYF